MDKTTQIAKVKGFSCFQCQHIATGMIFVLIPGGSYGMKGTDGHSNWVSISPFLMSRYSVTQAVWLQMMGYNPSYFPTGENHPVENVSWHQCIEFCNKTNLRLPSESEWEYACRAGSIDDYCFGSSHQLIDHYAWYGQSWNSGHHPVGQKQMNAFGLYDMHGNVYEWCEDSYQPSYLGAPNDGSAWTVKDSPYKVRRGGSYRSTAELCRCAERFYDTPETRGRNIGFRVCQSLSNDNLCMQGYDICRNTTF